mmetsp:Transcript_14535/g.47359  ORF Transcript_14535/g.47359 Transcript_14535/m.47359 type:complete len:232 (+) Transcript_14535:785-1480(+)
MVSLPSARSPGGLLLLGIRCLAGFAFHLFQVVWQPSLKRRFPDFTTADLSKFMTFVGILYAVSQGYVAQRALAFAHARNRTPSALILCCAVLCSGRLVAVSTTSLALIYAAYAAVIVALGVFNAALTSAVQRVAGPTERGGFYGLLSAVESVCGILGPIAGGLIATWGGSQAPEFLVCVIVVLLYAAAAGCIATYWRDVLLLAGETMKKDPPTATPSSQTNAHALAAKKTD